MKRIAILGSTGSIGVSTLDVVSRHPEQLEVVALAAGRNLELLAEQVARHRPRLVSIADAGQIARLRALIGQRTATIPEIVGGAEGATTVASHPEATFVMTAMVGVAGLRPTLAAIAAGREVGIANKEPLVAAGSLCRTLAERSGAVLLPVDSEHNAIFQCAAGQPKNAIRRVILTCSGGPFRERRDLRGVTVEEALAHPVWSMGPKISIDSATLMNKGLEIIEAHALFELAPENISVVIHPQGVVHSMVELVDGSILAQLATPDMRIPIAHALGFPSRLELGSRLDLFRCPALSFEAPDCERFPALSLARSALTAGGSAPCALNGANEVAVAAFLARKIPFLGILETVQRVLAAHSVRPIDTLDAVLDADRWARSYADELCG